MKGIGIDNAPGSLCTRAKKQYFSLWTIELGIIAMNQLEEGLLVPFYKRSSHMLPFLERHAYRTNSESFQTFLLN
jgi:hypothetical protein